jgi:hypothetical protein
VSADEGQRGDLAWAFEQEPRTSQDFEARDAEDEATDELLDRLARAIPRLVYGRIR